jgi:hypothetical protein
LTGIVTSPNEIAPFQMVFMACSWVWRAAPVMQVYLLNVR